jgi:hypothetical protein
LGFEGNIENEVELARKCKKEFISKLDTIPIFGVVCTQINLACTQLGVQVMNCVHTDNLPESVLASDRV